MQSRGVALVATLAMLTVISVMLVVFVTASRQDRMATASYSQSAKAESIGQGALQIIVSQLIGEMSRDGSAPDTNGIPTGKAIFTNLYGTNMVPQMVGVTGTLPTLVKISTNLPFYSGARVSSLNGTTNISTLPSLNNRSISLARWSEVYLGTFSTTTPVPCWVLVTRGGPTNAVGLLSTGQAFTATSSTALNNPTASNSNYVVGRFAYAIYDEGGLLDINAAGTPPTLPDGSLNATQSALVKGTLAGADVDLTALGINRGVLTGWRNASSGSGKTITTYTNYISQFVGTNGFGKVFPGDNTFLSRQDLIQAAKSGQAGILTTAALTNLTTFTRELAAPSWGPRTNGVGTSTINYVNSANSATSTNRLTTLVRFPSDATITSYHSDALPTAYTYPVKRSEPVLQHRFPLDRIKWLTPTGPIDSTHSAPIKAMFGLAWDAGNGVWRYVGSSPSGTAQSDEKSSIDTLSTVASLGREPNFFELLQAGIYAGSLAVTGGDNAYLSNIHQDKMTYQVLKIGAAIIDQYDDDSYPTVIEYKESSIAPPAFWQVAGVESLPYINAFSVVAGPSPNPPANTSSSAIATYCLVNLWNPHQAGTTQTVNTRVRLQGSITLANAWGQYPVSTASGNLPAMTATTSPAIASLTLSASMVGSYTNSTLLNSLHPAVVPSAGTDVGNQWALTSLAGPDGSSAISASNPAYVGYRLPDFIMDNTRTPQATDDWQKLKVIFDHFSYCLEFQSPAPGGQWVGYSYSNGINDDSSRFKGSGTWEQKILTITKSGTTMSITSLVESFQNNPIFITSDPRSTRFGLVQFNRITPASAPSALTMALWGTGTLSSYASSGFGGDSTEVSLLPSTTFSSKYYPATLIRNTTSSTSYYADRDGIQRISDSGLSTVAGSPPNSGNPYYRNTDRPIVLNRPFASVAEMGYAFRDAPWKTLDFFTANSADSGLLDLFCLSEEAVSTTTTQTARPPVIAGKLNLNTQNKLVLQAVLNGTRADEIGGSTLGNAAAMATAIVTQTSVSNTTGGPLVNKSELVTRILPSLPTSAFSTDDERSIKARREAMIRTLASVGQTRTWNLLIDLVAQSGKYPATADSLTKFIVEGERRYWLHVAIDRITGQVIDQQLEVVSQE